MDDIILGGATSERIQEVKKGLSNIEDLGELHYFWGMTVDQRDGEIWIGQPAYTQNLLRKHRMKECKPVSTPVDTSFKLEIASDDEPCVNQSEYQEV